MIISLDIVSAIY